MTGIGDIEWAAWALSVSLQLGLIVIVFYRRNERRFPLFTVYVAAAMLQSIAQFVIYKYWGFGSRRTLVISWSVQGLVIVFRLLAVLELCRLVFHGYRGIWVVISRALILLFAVVACSAMLLGRRGSGLEVLHADGATGVALAAAVVGLFLMARYYEVQAREPISAMAVGFFLYSCFTMLNDTVLEAWLSSYAQLWNFLSILAFIGTLLVWSWALRRAYPEAEFTPELLPSAVYRTLSPEVNLRLRMLNERLSRLTGQPVERP